MVNNSMGFDSGAEKCAPLLIMILQLKSHMTSCSKWVIQIAWIKWLTKRSDVTVLVCRVNPSPPSGVKGGGAN